MSSGNGSTLRQNDEHYDVIQDVLSLETSTQAVRSLPPVPTNHDGYTKLNYVSPTSENTSKVGTESYDNFVNSSYEEPVQNGSANQNVYLNSHNVLSTENVNELHDELGKDNATNRAVIVTKPQKEETEDDGLDASGYLKLYHVPSSENVSKLGCDMAKDSGDVVNQSDGCLGAEARAGLAEA